jgi:hypothetical protein
LATFLLDLVASTQYASFVPSVSEVTDKLRQNLTRDIQAVSKAKGELEEMREIADRIAALQDTVEHGSTRIVRVVEMLKDKSAKAAVLRNPALTHIHKMLRDRETRSLTQTVKLRVAIEEYLRVASRAKVAEIVEFLQAVGLTYAKRQTVESVIKRHPYDFVVTKDGRQKFVSRVSMHD